MSAHTVRIDRGVTAGDARRRRSDRLLILGAPAAAALAGASAEWLDFRGLKYPLLLIVLAGVVATAYAVERRGIGRIAESEHAPRGGRRMWRRYGGSLRALMVGVATWAAAETLYVMIHVVRGEAFAADRFGPQWAQALGLIGVHGLFLGAPTGIAAAVLLWAHARLWRGATS